MKECEKVYSELNKLNIPFEIIEHPAVTTTEEADKYVEGIEGVLSKSLFLTNDKKTAYYLLIMDDRDKLELVIEQYKFIKYLLTGNKGSYEKYLEQLEQYEVFSKDKAIMTMIDYKLARFSDEIFQEMGVKIIDRLDNGAVILQDMGLYKN